MERDVPCAVHQIRRCTICLPADERALAALALLEQAAGRSVRLTLDRKRTMELARPTIRRAVRVLRGRALGSVPS